MDSIDPAQVYKAIIKNKITVLTASPAFLEKIMAYLKTNHYEGLASINKIFAGGGAVTLDLMGRLARFFPNAEIHALYGSTEAEPIAHITGPELQRVSMENAPYPGVCLGRPVAEIEVGLDKKGYGFFAKQKRFGEILVSARHVSKSFFDVEKKKIIDKPKDPEGKVWHGTGDVGFIDEKGRIWFCGRVNNLLAGPDGRIPGEVIELEALAYAGGGRPAVIQAEDSIKIIAETAVKDAVLAAAPQIAAILMRYNLQAPDFIFVAKIPRDPRHRTKIDYHRLKNLLRKIKK